MKITSSILFLLSLLIAGQAFSEDTLDSIYKLNQDKTKIYAKNLELFQKDLLAKHPVILALFSSQGGRLILYRPGQEALEAPSVPTEYQIVKSIGHSTLALYSLVITQSNSWKESLQNYLEDNQKALASLDSLHVEDKLNETMKTVLQNNIETIHLFLQADLVSQDDIRNYTTKQLPYIQKLLERATSIQVGHWIQVLNEWKKILGNDFDKAYAVANCVYVTRARNILFTVLAQFFREEAFNDRLLLLETTDFTISPEAILAELTRIVSDRIIGDLFFGGKFEMDVELLGKAARKALEEQVDQLEHPLLLPALRQADDLRRWPW